MLIRLHKYLADKGVASRRKCEQYIKDGLVKVNGKTVKEMGIKIDPSKDVVETSPVLVQKNQDLVYFAFHKPVGYVCSVTGLEEPKIMELLRDIPERIFPVGRLDKLTSGLLLLTNDGRFAYEMTHPKFGKEKEYVVKIKEKITPQLINKLSKSFFIRGKKTVPAKIQNIGNHTLKIIIKEGRNRQIRRMCLACGVKIQKLKRIRIANVLLGDLSPKEYRKLTGMELSLLRKSQKSNMHAPHHRMVGGGQMFVLN